MGALAQEEVQVGKSEADERDPHVCAGHPFLIGRLDELAEDMKTGFERLGQKIEDMRVEQAETNQSLKGAWREINSSRTKIEEVPATIDKKIAPLKSKIAAIPGMIADAFFKHKSECAIGDITKTEIKFPDREDGQERRHGRGRRNSDLEGDNGESIAPRSGASVTLPKWVLYAVIIGGVLAIVSIAVIVGVLQPNDVHKILPAVTGSGQ